MSLFYNWGAISNTQSGRLFKVGQALGAIRGTLGVIKVYAAEDQVRHTKNMPVAKTVKKYRKKQPAKSKVATVDTVKRILMRQMELKQLSLVGGTGTITENTLYYYNISAQIVQGIADGNRIGDSINLVSLEFRYRFLSDTAANATTYRLIIGWTGEESNPSALNFANTGAFATTDVFAPVGALAFVNACINRKTFTPLFDTLIDINSQITGIADCLSGAFLVPLKSQKFDYQDRGAIYGKRKNLVGLLIGQNHTAATTCGDMQFNILIKFRDA